ncbi:hypothetical protein F4803DRAFT_192969 [Xylaria telfairii]|nr:hypothetical protein F4803DRAFT_192969 [Xylaria telfairii]
MATPVIQGTTRTNLGPLTTATWTYTCTEVIQQCGDCDEGWAAQTCISGVVTDNQDCWPPRATNVPPTSGALIGWGVYSPGIVCPDGYTSAVGATHGGSSDFTFQYPLTAGETAIGCCPKGGYIPILDVNQRQTCVQFKPTTSFLVGSCGNDGPVYTPFSVGGTLNSTQYNSFSVSAPFFQAVYKASDLPATSTSTPTRTRGGSTSSSSSPTTRPGASSSTSGHLSTGATAGIAVGSVLAAVIVAAAGFCAWRVRRRKQRATAAELPPTTFQPSEFKPFAPMAVNPHNPVELPNPTPAVELGPSR